METPGGGIGTSTPPSACRRWKGAPRSYLIGWWVCDGGALSVVSALFAA